MINIYILFIKIKNVNIFLMTNYKKKVCTIRLEKHDLFLN